jgi:hypothetical protein
MHLGVLRVLTEQTLEISSVVKDPTQPGPSLVTEVKDSSLTILHQFYSVLGAFVETEAYCWRFSAELGHTVLERVVRFAQRWLDLQ